MKEIEKLKAQLEIIQSYFINASIEEVTKDDLINMMLDDKLYVTKKIEEYKLHN